MQAISPDTNPILRAIYAIFCRSTGITTDTRKIEQDTLFFALKGDNFDGNNFAAQAIEKGALGAVVSNSHAIPPTYKVYLEIKHESQIAIFYNNIETENRHNPYIDERIGLKKTVYILVNDTLQTLQQLANYHRRQFKDIGIVALTGSNGKTTTKELIKNVLASEYLVHATQGNLNNHIGVPLTLLSMPAHTQIAIIEMGANHQGEIADLCRIAEPTHGIITGIGKAHLEGFGSIEGVAKAKGELFEYLRATNGYAFVNGNDKLVYAHGLIIPHHTLYGNVPDSEVNGVVATNEAYLSVWLHAHNKTTHHIETQLMGAYNLDNVLAAVAVGQYFAIGLQKIIAAINAYRPSNSRSQRIIWQSNTVIMDAYNANPTSMQAALRNLASIDAPSKAAILGEMLELGKESDAEHAHIVALLDTIPNLDIVVLIGKNYQTFAQNKKYRYFDKVSDAKYWFDAHHFKHTTILVKGSRGVALEKLFEQG